jgi:hypothetical protein
MLDFLFNSLWGWLTLSGVVVLALVAVAVLIPQFRLYALAGIAGVLGMGYWAAKWRAEGARKKQEEWNDAIERDVRNAEQARRDAERDVAADDPDGLRNDIYNRDRDAR